ncbi:TonB-dependent receptor [Halioxenophilus sp. WMMB6]|uniref:TonB-dependent receptor n=1 Tax=Halioxenophilus sp. WMMB6 TaxID=3073815 RepID=UPI00295E76A5|nr:TonB-dependent receptor [Halioxenophilus sp. WMMB6]
MFSRKNPLRIKFISAVISGFAVGLVPTYIVAAELEEVVVTAQKRSESLQNVAIAVSAFSGEELSNFGVSGTQGLQLVTPGLVFSNTGATGSPYLRGVGTRLALNGLEPSIATYVDDRYVSRATTSMMDFADVERIEVLKGPQGTLYGRNATGGAIRIITKDVADELEGSVKVGLGNFRQQTLSGTVSVPISESFGVRLTALSKKRDGYVDNLSPIGVSELDDQDYQAYRAKLRWDLTNRATARLTLGYWEKDDLNGNDQVDVSPAGLSTGLALGGITGTQADEAATEITAKDTGKEFSSQLRFDIAFDKADFASITTFTDMDQVITIDADGTSAKTLDLPKIPDETNSYSQEFQLVSNNDGNWSWVIGTNFLVGETDFEFNLDVGAGFLLSQGVQSVDTNAWAVYGESTWELSERWSLTIGGRWSEEEKEVEVNASSNAPVTIVSVPFQDKEDWSQFTPKATLEYNLEDVMYYMTLSRGFKSGGFDYPASGKEPLDPEILDMVEIGFKGDFLNRTLRANGSIFYYDYSDMQVTRSAAGSYGISSTENAASAEIFGFDLDITWLIDDRLKLTAGLSILDAKYKNYEANAKIFVADATGDPTATGMTDFGVDVSGEPLVRTPDWSGFVSAEYEFTLGKASVPMTVTYSYKDEFNFDFIVTDNTKALRQDAYGLLSARASYISQEENWIVSLWGNNLTDEEYFDDVVGAGRGLRASYAPPRTYGVDVTYNF